MLFRSSGFGDVPTGEWPAYAWHKILRFVTGRRTGRYMPADIRNREVPSNIRELKEIIRKAGRDYQHCRYDGPVFFVSAISRPWLSTQHIVAPWRAFLTGGLEHFFVRTRHLQLFDEPSLSRIAEQIASTLDKQQRNA